MNEYPYGKLEDYKNMLNNANNLACDLEFARNVKISGIREDGSKFCVPIHSFLVDIINKSIKKCAIELSDIIDYYRRHAAWLKTNLNGVIRCGNCGGYSNYKSDFCPSCGFKMDEKFASKKAEEIYTKIRIMQLDKLNKIKE